MSDAILAAGGFNEQANIVRHPTSMSVATASWSRMSGSLWTQPIALTVRRYLQSKDNINVLPHPQWREEATVQVFGEVKFPGTYTVRRGKPARS